MLSHGKNTGVVPATKTAFHHMLKPRVYCTTKMLVCRRFQNCLLSKVTWGESGRKDFEPRAQLLSQPQAASHVGPDKISIRWERGQQNQRPGKMWEPMGAMVIQS